MALQRKFMLRHRSSSLDENKSIFKKNLERSSSISDSAKDISFSHLIKLIPSHLQDQARQINPSYLYRCLAYSPLVGFSFDQQQLEELIKQETTLNFQTSIHKSSNQRDKLEIIYVISNPLQAKESLYKIGRHVGGIKKLVSRYTSVIPNLVLYFSYNVPTGLSNVIESIIQKKFQEYSLAKNGANDWYQVDLMRIINEIIQACHDIQNLASKPTSKRSSKFRKHRRTVTASHYKKGETFLFSSQESQDPTKN